MFIPWLFLLLAAHTARAGFEGEAAPVPTTTPPKVTESAEDVRSAENVSDETPTCSQQCSSQYLSYCTGFSNPLESELELSLSCHTPDLQPRDRYVAKYVEYALGGVWSNLTTVLQHLIQHVSTTKQQLPSQWFSPKTSIISALGDYKMSDQCNSDYQPMKDLICSWLYVSPCNPNFRICQEQCHSLVQECFPEALSSPETKDFKTILNFICHSMSNNNTDNKCYLPEEVYREDGFAESGEDGTGNDYITIISASAAVGALILFAVFVAGLRKLYLWQQDPSRDIKIDKFGFRDRDFSTCGKERARSLIRNNLSFPSLRASNRSLGDKSSVSLSGVTQSKKKGHDRNLSGQQLLDNTFNSVSELSLDKADCHSLNSNASTFYCHTNQSVSTIGDVMPPEAINFEGILSSRWKTADDEVIALVSWKDGMGCNKKGVIKCYTDKKRKLMEDELGVISQFSHDNVCDYYWRSMGSRPHIQGMSSHMQSVMSVRNNYFCTEYYSYGSLKDFLVSHGHFIKDTAAQSFVKDIISGMTYLHDLEVFHRDLKTANILVGNKTNKSSVYQLRLVISDFGLSQERHRQDCYIKDGSGGTSQYTAPEVLLSCGQHQIDLYKADVFAMSLVFWEILSYVGCENNEVQKSSTAHRTQRFCQVQHHTAFGDYLLAKFPDISSTSTSSNAVREYMRNMYRSNIHFRPSISERWSHISPLIKNIVQITVKAWSTEPSERPSTFQLLTFYGLKRYNSRLSLSSSKRQSVRDTLTSVLCINNTETL